MGQGHLMSLPGLGKSSYSPLYDLMLLKSYIKKGLLSSLKRPPLPTLFWPFLLRHRSVFVRGAKAQFPSLVLLC